MLCVRGVMLCHYLDSCSARSIFKFNTSVCIKYLNQIFFYTFFNYHMLMLMDIAFT